MEKFFFELYAAKSILNGLYTDKKAAMKRFLEAQLRLTGREVAIIIIFLAIMLTGAISALQSLRPAKQVTQSQPVKKLKDTAEVQRSCPYEMYMNRLLMY